MKFILVISLLLTSPQLFAWSEHHLITAAALSSVAKLKNKTVTPTRFEDLVTALGYSSARDFNEQNELRKEFSFDFKIGEKIGAPVSLTDVIAEYSDEPDWNMDTELFGPDEYPNLWKPEYAYMGAKTGVPSQAFRHMYWGKITFAHPITTFKFPSTFEEMGEAPTRAALFIKLARLAKEKGHPYWAARFVADSLHYLEDVSQPYHSTQVQTKQFMLFPFYPRFYADGKDYRANARQNYILKVTHVVTYYHFAFENYVAEVMLDANHQNTVEAELFRSALKKNPVHINSRFKLGYQNHDLAALVKLMSGYSAVLAPQAASASMDFFPDFQAYLRQNNLHLDNFNPPAFMDDAWWDKVNKAGQANGVAKQKYFKVVKAAFSQLGVNIRAVVAGEL